MYFLSALFTKPHFLFHFFSFYCWLHITDESVYPYWSTYDSLYRSVCLPLPGLIRSVCLPLPSLIRSFCPPMSGLIRSFCLPMSGLIRSFCLPMSVWIRSVCLPLPGLIRSVCLPMTSQIRSDQICLPIFITIIVSSIIKAPLKHLENDIYFGLFSLEIMVKKEEIKFIYFKC